MTDRRRGRPRLAPEAPASTSIHVRVTPAQRLDIRRVAEETGTNTSGILREAVNEFVGDFRDRQVFRRTK